MTQYPLSAEQKQALTLAQGGRCAICRKAFSGDVKAVVDHNHLNGEVRGILCGRCNSAIGFFLEDPETLSAAAEYVVVHRSHLAYLRGFDPMGLSASADILDAARRQIAEA